MGFWVRFWNLWCGMSEVMRERLPEGGGSSGEGPVLPGSVLGCWCVGGQWGRRRRGYRELCRWWGGFQTGFWWSLVLEWVSRRAAIHPKAEFWMWTFEGKDIGTTFYFPLSGHTGNCCCEKLGGAISGTDFSMGVQLCDSLLQLELIWNWAESSVEKIRKY